MIFRVLLSLFFSISLYAASDSLPSKVNTTLEVGIYLPSISATISNISGDVDFKEDFDYSRAEASYLSADIQLAYDYVPNIAFGYFNMQDNATTTLSREVRIADADFNSSISSQIDYQVFNLILYKDFKIKGQMKSLFGKSIYSGDFEFDIGFNTKLFMWKYQVQDLTKLTVSPSWIEVNELILLPYFGFRYYWYNFRLYSSFSALAFSSAKSTSYQYGVAYRVVDGLYLSVSYLSEEFKAVESRDTIDFQTDGYKFSVKYAF